MAADSAEGGRNYVQGTFVKEYIKIRAYWLAAFALNLIVVLSIYVGMRQLFRMDHAEVVWYRVIRLGQIFYDPFVYIPLITGLFLATVQFLPKMRNQRFRISLHLPVPAHSIVLGHVLVGLVALLLILCVDVALLYAATASRFPVEVANRMLLTICPWGIAGVTAYLGTTLVLLEPAWKPRVFNLAVSAGLTGLLLRSAVPGGYAHVLLPLTAMVLFFIPSVLLPAYRFRYRRG